MHSTSPSPAPPPQSGLQTPAQAIVLAAGRGERMRPLTDHCPKPLLEVRGKPLIQWHLEALAQAGCRAAVINTAWLGGMLEQRLGQSFPAGKVKAVAGEPQWTPPGTAKPALGDQNGSLPSSNIHGQLLNSEQVDDTMPLRYSHEGRDFGGALETAGGIARALPLLDEVFWVAAGDVFAPGFNYPATELESFRQSGKLAHIWLVPNPDHNPRGDFGLSPQGLALNLPKDGSAPLWTYSTIGLYRQAFFAPPLCDIPSGNPQGVKAALAPLLRAAMDRGQVSAALYTGAWTDVGTPERLAFLNQGENGP